MDSLRSRGPVPLLEDTPVPSQVDAEGGADERDRAAPEPLETPSLQFQFIGESGVSRPKGEALRLIRSRARRREPNISRKLSSLPKQRQSPLRPHAKLVRSKEISEWPVAGPSKTIVTRMASLGPTPRSKRIDPFDTLQTGEGGKSQYLISQYDSIFYPAECAFSSIRPLLRKGEALENSLSDPALLHASLAHVARTLEGLSSINLDNVMAYHVGKAITIVNHRIANQKTVTNETICAVTTLTALELRTSPMASVKIHLNGLEAMLSSVGGLKALVSNPFILKYTCWVDTVTAIVLGSKPRFAVMNLALLSLPPDIDNLEPWNLLTTRYKAKLCNLTGSREISQEMIDIYRMLRHLITKKERVASLQKTEISEADFQSFQSYCTHLIYRLISLVQYQSGSKNDAIFGLFGNAAVAHILMFTYNMPPRAGAHALLSRRIRSTLEVVELQVFQVAYPEMMLWIMMIGALGSIENEDETWFLKIFAELCCMTGIAGTAELALSLSEFLWSDFYLSPIFDEFWRNFVVAQAELQAGYMTGVGSL